MSSQAAGIPVHRNGHAFQVEGVGKSYLGKLALAPVSFSIERGERVAVMGPSGAGKTTLLNLMAGVIRPDIGRVVIAGHPAESLGNGRDLARLVGIMPQSFDLVPSLAVIHNVLAGRLGEWGFLRSLVSLVSPRDRNLAQDAVRRVGIPEKLYERTSRLSGGEQQRVALARLLVQNPQAILADEPVASLDPARAEDLVEMLVRLADEGRQTVVASLHSVPLALRHFSRIIALRQGSILFDRPTEAVTEAGLSELYALETVSR